MGGVSGRAKSYSCTHRVDSNNGGVGKKIANGKMGKIFEKLERFLTPDHTLFLKIIKPTFSNFSTDVIFIGRVPIPYKPYAYRFVCLYKLITRPLDVWIKKLEMKKGLGGRV